MEIYYSCRHAQAILTTIASNEILFPIFTLNLECSVEHYELRWKVTCNEFDLCTFAENIRVWNRSRSCWRKTNKTQKAERMITGFVYRMPHSSWSTWYRKIHLPFHWRLGAVVVVHSLMLSARNHSRTWRWLRYSRSVFQLALYIQMYTNNLLYTLWSWGCDVRTRYHRFGEIIEYGCYCWN